MSWLWKLAEAPGWSCSICLEHSAPNRPLTGHSHCFTVTTSSKWAKKPFPGGSLWLLRAIPFWHPLNPNHIEICSSEGNVKVKSLSGIWLFATPWTVAYEAPLSMGFFRQQYWGGLQFPSPGETSWPRDWTWVSCLPGRCFTVWATREAPSDGNLGKQSCLFCLYPLTKFFHIQSCLQI